MVWRAGVLTLDMQDTTLAQDTEDNRRITKTFLY